ncbi:MULTISPECIES: 50S ribosomal protein L30 [Hyphobacterium]|jgi:large subunit ribosomal protein L30|uniref:Large ribosomal subunit protein uL30 n=1 Tax=Hyphobacterium vulgare TaxID=1736751 RepID=A0ABV6ZTY7_9PROT
MAAKKTTIRVRQTGSATRRPDVQRRILTGLGLGRIGKEKELEDTPAIRGMIAKVAHMVTVIEG